MCQGFVTGFHALARQNRVQTSAFVTYSDGETRQDTTVHCVVWVNSLKAQPAPANFLIMSKDAIQAVVRELELLSDTDQRLVLRFLAELRRARHAENAPISKGGSALLSKDGLLVFAGQLEQPDTDWVQVVREERDDNVMSAALGRAIHP